MRTLIEIPQKIETGCFRVYLWGLGAYIYVYYGEKRWRGRVPYIRRGRGVNLYTKPGEGRGVYLHKDEGRGRAPLYAQ